MQTNAGLGRYSAGMQGLHEEIEAFHAKIHADGKEMSNRRAAIQCITRIITAEFPGVRVEYFGSTLTGLLLPASDIDVVVVVDSHSGPAAWLRGCFAALRRHSEVRFTEVVTHAKVPLLKLVDVATGMKLDLSCASMSNNNPPQGVANSNWIISAISRYPLLPKLVIVVKDLHEVYRRGVSSYTVNLMAISFFQHQATGSNLGSLLLQFFQYYGKDFDFDKQAIIVTGNGAIISKSDMKRRLGFVEMSTSLSIQDPVEVARDAAAPSHRGMEALKRAFREAHDALQRAVDRSTQAGDSVSFLEVIFDYNKRSCYLR
ncbi:terminal nucleotidyltransferase 4A-like [Paramacrobiotus metropolitanus]|uniref:terminal nucleotidyltransferase 4A-like n=1 Tax=Paramacrobiotus metropolitanus TaxID=2943436 RepID=UPI0024457925|nr:terminal nucleotidyltransferase 4A-like [Paramacrobiotus metropolitanus]